MGIILRLTCRYMKQNRRRTAVTIMAVALAVCALTVVVLFTASMMRAEEEAVIEREGGWHVTFHGVTKRQAEQIDGWKKAKKTYPAEECADGCVEMPGNAEVTCISAEMKHPGIRTLKAAQTFAGEIGMKELPEEEWLELSDHTKIRYRVTYHDELLQYHGVFSQGAEGIGAMSACILVVIILLFSVCIYNSFAVSVFEKMRYLGMLGSVGATKFQKSACILLEGVLEGLAGILLGCGIGIPAASWIVKMVGDYAFERNIILSIGAKEVVLILGCGVILVLLACTIPSSRAAKASVLDLLIRPYPEKLDGQKLTSLKKKHRVLGVEGALALKNIFLKERQYSACIGVLSLSFCILLGGTAALKVRNGEYDVADPRDRQEAEISVNLTCPPEKRDTFYSEVRKLPEVEDAVMVRQLLLSGILVDEAEMRGESGMSSDEYEMELREESNQMEAAKGEPGEKQEAKLENVTMLQERIKDDSGRTASGYLIRTRILGLDAETFSRYAKEAGVDDMETGDVETDGEMLQRAETYPVIIEDYQLQPGLDGNKVTYDFRPQLREMKNETFQFVFSRQADMETFSMEREPDGETFRVKKLEDGQFHVLAATQKASPGPKTVEGADGVLSMYSFFGVGGEDELLDIYMREDTFEQLLQDEVYKDTFTENPIESYSSVAIERVSDEMSWTEAEQKHFHADVKMRAKEDAAFQKKITALAEKAGIKPEEYAYYSAAKNELDVYRNSDKQMVQILGYGAIACIVLGALTGIIQKISTSGQMRRKEYAMLLSMGMTRRSLRKMIAIENSVYGILTGIFGIPFSIFLTKSQFTTYQGVAAEMPYYLIGVEMLIVVVVTVFPVLYGFRQIKALDVIGSLKGQEC